MAQEVTYAEVRFSRRISPPAAPKGPDGGELTYENIPAPGAPAKQNPRPERGVTRLLLPMVLGLVAISLLLLAAVVGLGAKNWQLSQQLQETSWAYEARSHSLLEAQKQVEVAWAELKSTRASLEQQKQDREAVLNATWTTAWKGLCPTEWVLFQGKCLFFSRKRRAWEESEKDCELKASHLAITRSWALDLLPVPKVTPWLYGQQTDQRPLVHWPLCICSCTAMAAGWGGVGWGGVADLATVSWGRRLREAGGKHCPLDYPRGNNDVGPTGGVGWGGGPSGWVSPKDPSKAVNPSCYCLF